MGSNYDQRKHGVRPRATRNTFLNELLRHFKINKFLDFTSPVLIGPIKLQREKVTSDDLEGIEYIRNLFKEESDSENFPAQEEPVKPDKKKKERRISGQKQQNFTDYKFRRKFSALFEYHYNCSRLERAEAPSSFSPYQNGNGLKMLGVGLGFPLSRIEDNFRGTPHVHELELFTLPFYTIMRSIFKKEPVIGQNVELEIGPTQPPLRMTSLECLIINDPTRYFYKGVSYRRSFVEDLYEMAPNLKRLELTLELPATIKRFITHLPILADHLNHLIFCCPINEQRLTQLASFDLHVNVLVLQKLNLTNSALPLVKFLEKQAPTMERLSLSCNSSRPRMLIRKFPTMAKLTHLILDDENSLLPLEQIRPFKLPSMEHLIVNYLNYQHLITSEFTTSSIKCVKLVCCTSMDIFQFQNIPLQFPHLNKLALVGVKACYLSAIFTHFTRLEDLSLKDCEFQNTDSLITGIPQEMCPHFLPLWEMSDHNTQIVESLRAKAGPSILDLTRLKKLKIILPGNVSDVNNDLTDTTALLAFMLMKRMTKLVLHNTTITQDVVSLIKTFHRNVDITRRLNLPMSMCDCGVEDASCDGSLFPTCYPSYAFPGN